MLQAPLLLRVATCMRPPYLTMRAYASISCAAAVGLFYRVIALTFTFGFLKRTATRGRMFRKPIQPPVSRRPDALGKEIQPEPAVPPITNEAVWNGHFPDADRDIQASIEYSNQGLRELLANDTLVVTRYDVLVCQRSRNRIEPTQGR